MKSYIKRYKDFFTEQHNRLLHIERKENEIIKMLNDYVAMDEKKREKEWIKIPDHDVSMDENRRAEDLPAIYRKREKHFLGQNVYADYYELKRAYLVKKMINGTKIRLGRANDGGYICVDEVIVRGGVAYSFGISDDVSWDLDVANKYGCDVYQYDHTIGRLPQTCDKFHFHRLGISANDEAEQKTMSLPSLLKANGHMNADRMILKMDVEGAEWEVLENLPQDILKRFGLLVMEMHDFHMEHKIKKYTEIVKKLNLTHQLVHLHANNCGDSWYCGDIVFTHAVEVTYVRKDLFEFEDALFLAPQSLDQPCNPHLEEAVLGNFGREAKEHVRV